MKLADYIKATVIHNLVFPDRLGELVLEIQSNASLSNKEKEALINTIDLLVARSKELLDDINEIKSELRYTLSKDIKPVFYDIRYSIWEGKVDIKDMVEIPSVAGGKTYLVEGRIEGVLFVEIPVVIDERSRKYQIEVFRPFVIEVGRDGSKIEKKEAVAVFGEKGFEWKPLFELRDIDMSELINNIIKKIEEFSLKPEEKKPITDIMYEVEKAIKDFVMFFVGSPLVHISDESEMKCKHIDAVYTCEKTLKLKVDGIEKAINVKVSAFYSNERNGEVKIYAVVGSKTISGSDATIVASELINYILRVIAKKEKVEKTIEKSIPIEFTHKQTSNKKSASEKPAKNQTITEQTNLGMWFGIGAVLLLATIIKRKGA